MPRTARSLGNGGYFHIINRGNDRRVVFRSRLDYLVFIGLMKEAKRRFPLSIHGFCLMPNHIHLIVRALHAENLSAFMQWLAGCYSRHFHESYGTSGHLWQGRFKGIPIDSEEYLIVALRYVEGNPKRAGLVDSNRKWEWSSLGDHCARDYTKLIDAPPFYLADGWLELVDTPLNSNEFETVRRAKRVSPAPGRDPTD